VTHQKFAQLLRLKRGAWEQRGHRRAGEPARRWKREPVLDGEQEELW
jgi:hypothetical protein